MNIGIVGLGLIGGSLGRVLVKNDEHRIFAADIDAQAMLKGKLLDAYHEELDDQNAGQLDVLLICLYPQATISAMRQYAPLLKDGAVIADCAGIKRKIVAEMKKMKKEFPNLHFLATHPMAGREFSGVQHSTATLFEKSSVLFVPIDTPLEIRALMKRLFLSTGAEHVIFTTAEEHDQMISYTSQLAHIVSSSYVDNPNVYNFYGFTAGSFRDMTRVAKLNPTMWAEIMLENRDYLHADLGILIDNLCSFRHALEAADLKQLEGLLAKGNEIKTDIEANRPKKVAERAGQSEKV